MQAYACITSAVQKLVCCSVSQCLVVEPSSRVQFYHLSIDEGIALAYSVATFSRIMVGHLESWS